MKYGTLPAVGIIISSPSFHQATQRFFQALTSTLLQLVVSHVSNGLSVNMPHATGWHGTAWHWIYNAGNPTQCTQRDVLQVDSIQRRCGAARRRSKPTSAIRMTLLVASHQVSVNAAICVARAAWKYLTLRKLPIGLPRFGASFLIPQCDFRKQHLVQLSSRLQGMKPRRVD